MICSHSFNARSKPRRKGRKLSNSQEEVASADLEIRNGANTSSDDGTSLGSSIRQRETFSSRSTEAFAKSTAAVFVRFQFMRAEFMI